MTNSNARVAFASIVGLLVGAAAGRWLRGESPCAESEPARAQPTEKTQRAASPSRGERPTRSRSAAEGSGRDRELDAVVERSKRAGASGGRPSGAGSTSTEPTADRSRPDATLPEPSAIAASAGESPARSNAGAPREADGVVIDAVTQRPIDGARVAFAFLGKNGDAGWTAVTSDAEGRFHPRVDDDTKLAGRRLELRVSKPGYESAILPIAAGAYRVELRPRTTLPTLGRVVGLARAADGKPYAGELVVEAFSDLGDFFRQHAQSDAGGSFRLEGMPAGPLRLRWDGGPYVDVTVPETGDARVELTSPSAENRSNFVVTDIDPSNAKTEDPKAKATLDGLLRLLGEVDQNVGLDAAARERLKRSLAFEVQTLVTTSQAALPRRDVVVTGLPTDGRAWLRLETKPRDYWRVEIQNGVARFASVPIGPYTAVIERPDKPDETSDLVVPRGDETFESKFR